ncbi:MAG: flagellar biosynthesis anti-sigma factor FlgM [Pseudomonadota bacterium]|jgi:negative regulator of flagellin synthesis FlgM
MSSFEIGAPRPVGAIQVKTVAATQAPSAPAEAQATPASTPASTSAAAQVETSDAVKAGSPPIDTDRVTKIRHAIETGTYPVLPAKIADAMIAAGMLLRSPQ